MRNAAAQAAMLDAYAKSDDPEIAERAQNWQIGIGLQAVDNLNVSSFLLETAERQILGEISMDEAVQLIEDYHRKRRCEEAADEQN